MNSVAPPHDSSSQWSTGVATGVSDIVGARGRLAFWSLGIFAAWAVLFPLSSAVIAPATLIAKGDNKVLQHRSGGVVREILAVNGDRLKAGDTIAVLSPEIDRAQLSRLRAQYSRALAQKARLQAEKRSFGEDAEARDPIMLRGGIVPNVDASAVTSSFSLTKQVETDPELQLEQQREFETGRAAANAAIDGLQQRAEAMAIQQQGLAERMTRIEAQVRLLATQRAALAELVAADHVSRQQLWDMETRLLERQAALDDTRAEHDALANSIAETQAQIEQSRASDERKTSESMTQVLTEIAELADQVKAAELGLDDTVVRAPADGVLVHSKLTTIGAVVPAGQTFGEIVPAKSGLLVQARIGQHDIANVHIGQSAKITISALNSRIYDPLVAKVTYVAADATTDERTGERFFEVRADLEAPPASLDDVLTPGMGGQAQIQGPSRTFLGYLMRPISDSFSRAFKEQR